MLIGIMDLFLGNDTYYLVYRMKRRQQQHRSGIYVGRIGPPGHDDERRSHLLLSFERSWRCRRIDGRKRKCRRAIRV
ncbi:hypothetical protein MAH48_09750 [Anoxybacillus flavithermus]|nr:hypothetical protein [Anoxybacillus flavithermus]